jgi:tyrosyl-tRNA synthetase
MALYEELLWRDMIKDVSHEDKARDMLNNGKVTFYCGFDPTGESLTVGHLVQIVRMRLLQSYGHRAIALIGGATGLIGDPRQTSERKLLTLEASLANAKQIKTQLSKVLDPDHTVFVNNYDWTKDIDMITFLRDYGKLFSINYMLAKDTVQQRLPIGISYTEFSYMILQAIDFLHLYKTYDCTLQFGGSDQWGNITSGLELIRKSEGDDHRAFGMSSPLLLKSDGTKFGKSESGTLWMDARLTSPYEIYQYFINVADSDVLNDLKMLTLLDRKTIEGLIEEMAAHPEERTAQKVLAAEVVTFMHGKEALQAAIDVTDALFSGNFDVLDQSAFKMLEQTLETVVIKESMGIIDLLSESHLAQSNREARTFITQGAVFINGKKVDAFDHLVDRSQTYHDTYVVIRRGKKKYALGVFER